MRYHPNSGNLKVSGSNLVGFFYRWDHTDLDVDRDLFDLNVFAPVNLSRLVMPHFHAQSNGGTFVIVSSLAGRFGVPFSGTYTGSKHAINVSHPKTNSLFDTFRNNTTPQYL